MTPERLAKLRAYSLSRLFPGDASIQDAALLEAASELLDEIERLSSEVERCRGDVRRVIEIHKRDLGRLDTLRLSDADRAALATASSELRERRNNWTATYARLVAEQQDNAVTDSYRRTIAEVTAAIEVVDRLRGAK